MGWSERAVKQKHKNDMNYESHFWCPRQIVAFGLFVSFRACSGLSASWETPGWIGILPGSASVASSVFYAVESISPIIMGRRDSNRKRGFQQTSSEAQHLPGPQKGSDVLTLEPNLASSNGVGSKLIGSVHAVTTFS